MLISGKGFDVRSIKTKIMRNIIPILAIFTSTMVPVRATAQKVRQQMLKLLKQIQIPTNALNTLTKKIRPL